MRRILFVEEGCPFCGRAMKAIRKINSSLVIPIKIVYIDHPEGIVFIDLFKKLVDKLGYPPGVKVTPVLYLDGYVVVGCRDEVEYYYLLDELLKEK